MSTYNPKKIEGKWQKYWEKKKSNQAKESSQKKKFYALVEFPYPSGDGLHIGHIRSYTALDVVARKKRAEGYNVLYPMGWDAFGLPTENYAIKTGIHPKIVTKKNTDNFRRQLKSLGLSFDWDREINTTDPHYYKWTQWIFLKLFEKGLAYKAKHPINWCLNCKIGLADEEVVDGKCERCGGEIEKREKEQWMLAITKYAERLDRDLDDVDFQERIITQQRNWIGRSEGAEIDFQLTTNNRQHTTEKITVFTTRPDTIFGATYLVLAPEHPAVAKHITQITNRKETEEYVRKAAKKTEIERTAEGKEKTGVLIKGIKAINPASEEEIPIYISDYVLSHYGTGAIMAVPAHDERDYAFAKTFSIPIRQVIGHDSKDEVFTGYGALVNSGKFSGTSSEKARKEITKFVGGTSKTSFKLRDWVFSRQRYWGEPIPLVYCQSCAEKITNKELGEKQGLSKGEVQNPGWFAVPEKDLPVVLPNVKSYKPTDTGESPLSSMSGWVNTKCPHCKGKAQRETDVMPNWAGSSWYFLRYADSKNKKAFASKGALKYWTPVDWYNGGMEHTTLHLLYSRFWHKFLYDQKLVPTKEPYKKRTSHGLILAEGGVKMSKSKGNTISPDSIVSLLGADTLRHYEMFMGPFDQTIAWNSDAVAGSRRFLERVYSMGNRIRNEASKKKFNVVRTEGSKDLESLLHQTIKKIGEDIEDLKMNTALSQLMILLNALEKEATPTVGNFKIFLRLLAPFTPHLSEEIWSELGEKSSIHLEPWPRFNPRKLVAERISIPVQINGKVRTTLTYSRDLSDDEVKGSAMAHPDILRHIVGKKITRVIYVKDRIVNIVL